MRIGYIRTGERLPKIKAQQDALHIMGVNHALDIHEDIKRRKVKDREKYTPGLKHMIDKCVRDDDEVCVHSLAVLGNTVADILDVILSINEKKAGVIVHDIDEHFYMTDIGHLRTIISNATKSVDNAKMQKARSHRKSFGPKSLINKVDEYTCERIRLIWKHPNYVIEEALHEINKILPKGMKKLKSTRALYSAFGGRK